MSTYLPNEKTACFAKKDVELKADFSLPEYLPGISRIIRTGLQTESCSCTLTQGGCEITAALKFSVLYISDFKGKIKSAVFRQSETITLKDATDISEEAVIIPSLYASGLIVIPEDKRKIRLRCTLHAGVTCHETRNEEVYSPEDDSKHHLLSENIPICQKKHITVDSFEITDEKNISSDNPPCEEVVLGEAYIRAFNVKSGGGNAVIEGKADFSVLYEAYNENSDSEPRYISAVFPADFSYTLEDEAITENSVISCFIEANSCNVSSSFDNMGEGRLLSLSANCSLCACIYNTDMATVYLDVFSEECEVDAQYTAESFDVLVSPLFSTESLTESAPLSSKGLTDISCCSGKINSVSTLTSEGKHFAAAKCSFDITGTNELGELICTDTTLTYHVPICETRENCNPEIMLSIKECSASIKDGELTVTADFGIGGALTEKKAKKILSSVSENQGVTKEKDRDTIYIFYPHGNYSLWDVAKKYSVSPEALMQANNLENDDISDKHSLIIPV